MMDTIIQSPVKGFRFGVSLLLPFTVISIEGMGQSSLEGQVKEENGKPLAYATILLLNAQDSVLLKGMVSNEEGIYRLDKVEVGEYLLSANMVGYEKMFSPPFRVIPNQPVLVLEPLVLRENVTTLGEVVVAAEKPLFEQKIDRLVVNVENSVTMAGGTALNVLQRSPGVILNQQNSTLSLNGKQGVMLMINGKQTRIPVSVIVQMLSGMNAENVEKVELFATPPASFDAEGDAGVINIVLKKNTNFGTNGTFSLNAGYGKGERLGTGINLNHRRERFNIYGDYAYYRDNSEQSALSHRWLDYEGEFTETYSNSLREPVRTTHTARLGLDYSLSTKTTIGALVSGYSNRFSMDALNAIEINSTTLPSSQIQMNISEINHWKNLMGNVYLTHNFSQGQQLSFDFDYLYYHDKNPSQYKLDYLESSGTGSEDIQEMKFTKDTPINVWVGKIDYSSGLGEKGQWEVGIKSTRSTFTNDIGLQTLVDEQWQFEENFTNKYDLEENVYAAYTSLNMQLNDKTQLITGLRWEYTNTELNAINEAGIVDREYNSLFPSVFFSRKLKQDHTLQFSYSRRITRPTFNDLAPFAIFQDPYTFISGNPALQPAFTDAVKADYRYKSYLLSFQYSYDKDAIAPFQPRIDPETNEMQMIAENLDHRHNYSLTLSLPFTITPWWELQTNFIGVFQKIKTVFEGENIAANQSNFNINATQTFSLPMAFVLEISGFYQSRTLFGLMEVKPFGTLDVGVQKKIANGRGMFRLAATNILETNYWRFYTDIPELHLKTVGKFVLFPGAVILTFTWNFGNQQVKSAGNRTTGSEEERKRVTN